MADKNSRTRLETFGIRPDLFEALQNTKAAQAQSLFEALSGKSADAAKVTADLERLNSQLQEHGEAAPGGLIPAYIEANTRRWQLQEQIDALQSWQIESIKKMMEFNQQISPFTFAPRSTSVVKQGIISVRTSVNDWNGGFELTNLTDWMDLRVAIGYQQSVLLGSGGFVSDEFTIKPGAMRQYLPSSGNVAYSNLFISVTPIPLKAFEPPPPPHI